MAEAGNADRGFDPAAFRVPALDFVTLLRAHIAKEDHILFPMAERMLDPDVLGRLDTACSEVEPVQPATCVKPLARATSMPRWIE